MACEWIAPVATATVGVAGIIFTWLTGKQGRDDAKAIAKEAREQQRLENAYIELLRMAERVGQWAQMIHPVVQSGELPATPLPSLEMQADTAALVNAYGTAAVRQRMETWEVVVRQMITAAELVAWEEADPSGRRLSGRSQRVIIHELRPREAETRQALADQVAAELGHRKGKP